MMSTQNTKRARRLTSIAWPIPVVFGLCLPMLMSADTVPALRAYGSETPWAGIGQSGDEWNQSATAADLVGIDLGDRGPDGSYSDAYARAVFGYMGVRADAYRNFNNTFGVQGNAGGDANAEFVDYVLPGGNSPIGFADYLLILSLDGVHTRENGWPVYSATAVVHWDIRDIVTNTVYANGYWYSSDNDPLGGTKLAIDVGGAPANDLLRIDVSLEAIARVFSADPEQYRLAQVDYSHTLQAVLTTDTPGASTMGLSGHDYAAAPEPGTLTLLGSGLAAVVFRRLHKRRAGLNRPR
jgi:PEP-CTERM motif